MIRENEVVMLLLGLGVLVFILANRSRLRRLPRWDILSLGFYVVLAGWLLTVAEGFLFGSFFNYLEHICYACSAVLLAVWSWRISASGREAA